MLIKHTANSIDSDLLDIGISTAGQKKSSWIWSSGYIANRADIVQRYGLFDQSTTDEVLFLLFQRLGAAAVANIVIGPCSWVAWDSAQKLLTVVSDRMGLTPVYHTEFAGSLWLADDADVLLDKAGISRQINPRAVVAKINLMPMPEDESIYQDIYKFPQATIWTYKEGHSNLETYWQAKLLPVLKLKNDQEYAEAWRTLLVQVVNEHVPREHFTLTLSSGMDSSSVAGALRLARPNEHLACLGWIMPELENNEEEWIRATCQKLDLDLTVLQADQFWPLKPNGAYTELPCTVVYQEAWIATYLELKRQNKQVLIDGAMGDQCFGNDISSYADLLFSLRWLELGKQIRHEMVQGFQRNPNWKTPFRLALQPLRKYIKALLPPKPRLPVPWLHPSRKLLYDQIKYVNQPPRKFGLPARVERWWAIINTGSLQNILPYHKLARSIGIELRHPLWDHRILEFALQLPAEQTYRAGIQKIILRNAMRGILPDKVVTLSPKILPVRLYHRGLRERSVEQVQHLMMDMRLAEMGYVLPEKLKSAYLDYLTQKTDKTSFFQTLIIESQIRAWL